MENSKKKRYPVVAVGGWRPDRFSKYNKRLSCHGRVLNTISTNCRRRSRGEAQVPNSVEEDKSAGRSVGTGVQQFSDDEDPTADASEDDDYVKTLEGLPAKVTTADCNKCESSSGRHVHRQEMQTISEEDLVALGDREEAINCPVIMGTIGSEQTRRILERESKIHSKTPNVGKKFWRSPAVRCTRHKCSRCSQFHSRINRSIQSVVADYFKSLISTTRPTKICRMIRPSTQKLPCPHNYEVSLDAFRPPKRRPNKQSSIMWKVATAIYEEITGILKDGIVKLLPQDQESERSPLPAENCRGDECKDKRNVGTGVEQVSSANCTRRTKVNNDETRRGTTTANRTEEATRRWVANCKISTHSNEEGKLETSRGEKSQNVVGAERPARRRENTFAPKTTTSGSSISSLSSSSSFRYSCSATDDERLAKKTENYSGQESEDQPASAAESTVGLTTSTEDWTNSATTVRVNNTISQNEDLDSYDEIDTRSSINHPLTDVDNMPGNEDDFSSVSSVLVEPAEISYEIEDLGKSSGPVGRTEYSNSSTQRELVRERIGNKSCREDGSTFREGGICYSSEEGSEASTSSNREYDIRPRRKLKLSARARQNSSRLGCQEGFARRNCAVKEITSRTDCKSGQPHETFVQSYLEYFKEIELEEVPLEPAPGPQYCSKIPRLVRHGFVAGHGPVVSQVPRCEGSGSESSSSAWGGEHELLAERTATNVRRRTRISSSSGPPRNFKSTSHHFYV